MAKNIFEKRRRKFLSIGSSAGKYWNKTSFPCKKCADAPIIRRKKCERAKLTGLAAHSSNWEFSSSAYTKNRHTGTMSVYRYTTTYMEDTEHFGCLTRRTCDNQTMQHGIPRMSQWSRDSSSRAKEPHRCRISVRVITLYLAKFRLLTHSYD